jgi:uncharacterized membrane protein
MRGRLFVALLLAGSLFALTGLRQIFIEPLASTGTNIIWFIVQVSPLLLVLPGFLRMQTRSAFYMILAAMLYFIHGVLEAATPEHRLLAGLEIVVSVALMGIATWVLRQLRERDGRLLVSTALEASADRGDQ